MMPQVRSATLQDIPTIQSLSRDIWSKAYEKMISPEQMSYMLNWMYSTESLTRQFSEGHQFLIVEVNLNTPLGYASYQLLSPNRWKLEKLYVQVEKHRQGLGKLFVQNILGRIRKNGGTHLELQVNRANPAVGFYDRQGFRIIREEDFDIGNGFSMNDYIMEKTLD